MWGELIEATAISRLLGGVADGGAERRARQRAMRHALTLDTRH